MKTKLIILIISIAIHGMVLSQKRYNTWELFKYSGPGLKQTGWLATKHSGEIESSPWSVGCETLDRDYAKFSVYKDYVGSLGVKSGRLQSGWAKCERVKGVYDFAWLDSCVYGLAEQSVKPWICLCYGNPLYKSDHRLKAKIFTDDETMTAWLNYVKAVVLRYKDIVKEWEIWNEPNNGNEEFEVYASLLIKTAEVIRNVQSDAIIIGLALYKTPLDYTKGVLETLKANNKLDLIDYISYHPYTNNPDDSYEDVERLRDLMQSYNPKYKLFQGENGCPSILEWGHALRHYPWTEISQAKWIMRRMAGDRVRDIRSSIFTIIDLKYPNMLQSFGLLRSNLLSEIIYKRPSYYGVQHMVSFFDYSVKPVGELLYTSNSYRKISVAGFKKNDSSVALIWFNDQIPGDDLKWDLIDMSIKDVNFNDPVYVEMISGKVYDIDKSDWVNENQNVSFRNLPVWDSVIMIVERSQIIMKEDM